MKICMWGAAVLLATGASAQAADIAGAGRQTEASGFSAENLAVETAVTATLWPGGTSPSGEASGWHQFRYGCLWDDYCLPKQFSFADSPAGEICPEGHPASWLRTLWPWRGTPDTRCRTCRTRRTSALEALCNLFGWRHCRTHRVACPARVDCPEPTGSVYFDDPAPLPPAPQPTREESPDQTNTPVEPPERQTPLVEPVPIPEETLEQNTAPHETDDMELPPTPEDDPPPAPAPEPQPEIPRNKLPKPQPANAGTTGAASRRTVVTARLSDYIRTR
jgi:hypothetical protein